MRCDGAALEEPGDAVDERRSSGVGHRDEQIAAHAAGALDAEQAAKRVIEQLREALQRERHRDGESSEEIDGAQGGARVLRGDGLAIGAVRPDGDQGPVGEPNGERDERGGDGAAESARGRRRVERGGGERLPRDPGGAAQILEQIDEGDERDAVDVPAAQRGAAARLAGGGAIRGDDGAVVGPQQCADDVPGKLRDYLPAETRPWCGRLVQ